MQRHGSQPALSDPVEFPSHGSSLSWRHFKRELLPRSLATGGAVAGTACDTKVDSWFHHRVRVQYRILSEPNMPPTKGKAGKGRAIAPNIGERMLEVEQRVESLDAAIRQIHPEYAGPIVNRQGGTCRP